MIIFFFFYFHIFFTFCSLRSSGGALGNGKAFCRYSSLMRLLSDTDAMIRGREERQHFNNNSNRIISDSENETNNFNKNNINNVLREWVKEMETLASSDTNLPMLDLRTQLLARLCTNTLINKTSKVGKNRNILPSNTYYMNRQCCSKKHLTNHLISLASYARRTGDRALAFNALQLLKRLKRNEKDCYLHNGYISNSNPSFSNNQIITINTLTSPFSSFSFSFSFNPPPPTF